MQYTNKGGRKGTKRGDRSARTTHYGFTPEEKTARPLTGLTGYKTLPGMDDWGYGHGYGHAGYPSTQPKFKPVSDEVTVYGAKKFRTPYTKDEYVGTKGSPIPAYVFDIDGTLQGYGQGLDKDVAAWAAKLYKADPHSVFLIITARDHGTFGYETSFNWLMKHFPYPFIGPFARPKDDPRYASEFKRELVQSFEDMGLYQIMGAADDNKFVIDMWKQWAIDHFEDPEDFDLLECSYGSYSGWRSDLPSKGTGYTSTTSSYTNLHKDEHWNQTLNKYESDFRDGERWVAGYSDKSNNNKWVPGHWEKDPTAKAKPATKTTTTTTTNGKHRAAGTVTSSRYGVDPVDKVYKKVDEFLGTDLSENPAWKAYFDKREATGAYVGEPILTDEDQAELDEVIDAFESGYTLWREDLKQIVRHDNPTFSDAELDDMTDEELRELAGMYIRDGENEEYDGEPVFTDTQLGIANPIAEQESLDERNARVQYRLDIEDEVYAIRQDLKADQIANMDLKVLESYIDQPTLDAIHDRNRAFTGEVRDILADTAPLDVAEVLSELEGDVTIGYTPSPAVQGMVDEYLASKNGTLEPFPKASKGVA